MNAAKVEFRVSNDGKFQWHKCSSNPEIRTIGEHAYYCVHEHRKQDDLIDNRNGQCLKITEKVAFKIASEASYVYILSGQKLNKNAKNGPFGEFFENL